jgi:putative inorganic carbon (hco3(-)) transporter
VLWPALPATEPAAGRLAGSRDTLLWGAVAVLAGLVIGAGASVSVIMALGLAVALALAVALVRSPGFLLSVLAASIFVDAVDVGVPLGRLLAPVAVVVVVACGTTSRSPLARAPLAWALAYTTWALASQAWTVSAEETRFQVLSLAIALVYMIAFATLVRSERDLVRTLRAFVFSAVAVGLVAIMAFALQLPGLTQEGRAYGLAGDPNFFAIYQTMAIPMALVLLAGAPPEQRRLLYIGVAVLVLSVFASVSRGGLVSLAVMTCLMLAAPARGLFDSRRQRTATLGALVGALLVAGVLSGAAVTERVEAVGSSDVTGSGRTALWSAARTSIDDRPILGLGFGAFPAVVNDLLVETPGIDFRHIELEPDGGSEAHNVYISSLAEIGLPGLALFLGLLIATARELRRAAAIARRTGAEVVARAANALLFALAGWSVASLFLTTETSRALWIVIGIALALPGIAGAGSPAPARRRPPLLR